VGNRVFVRVIADSNVVRQTLAQVSSSGSIVRERLDALYQSVGLLDEFRDGQLLLKLTEDFCWSDGVGHEEQKPGNQPAESACIHPAEAVLAACGCGPSIACIMYCRSKASLRMR